MDFIHVLEYLWEAARGLSAGDAEAAVWVQERALKVLQGQAREVAAGLRRSATLRGLLTKQREAVDTCADYLLNGQSAGRFHVIAHPAAPTGQRLLL